MTVLLITLIILVYFIIETIYRDYFKYKRDNVREVNRIETFLEDNQSRILILSGDLAQNFQCRLCGCRNSDSNVISFSGKEYSHISRKRPHKFLKLTCRGCGLTDFFNMNQLWGPDGLDPLPIDQPLYSRFAAMADDYDCLTCENRSAVAKIVTARKKGLRHMLSPEPSELVCLCCKKCGWSSFFDVELTFKEEHSHA